MFNFPFYGFPYRNPYYGHYSPKPLQPYECKQQDNNIEKRNSITDSKKSSNTDSPILEILGIKLYLDDIIIIIILFFLYQEKVNDEMLYIILLLLLFS